MSPDNLGVIISHNKVEMDPVKIAGVADWPTPSNKKEVQSFIGFVNFYQRFIPGFSHHARALFDLTMKDVSVMKVMPPFSFSIHLQPVTTLALTNTERTQQIPLYFKVR
jgi:hypothetical protein